EKAARIAAATSDISEILGRERAALRALIARPAATRIAYHPPCTLQHGQKLASGGSNRCSSTPVSR
ncbi:MAG: hypothetical protein ACYC5S_01010, partial [Thiobacillus sp.]